MEDEKKQNKLKECSRGVDTIKATKACEEPGSNTEKELLQVIDIIEEVGDDIELLKDLVIICRFIGPRLDRKKITEWIENTWQTPQITKFMSKGFFIVVFAIEEEHQKILEGGLWTITTKPLYINKWYRNFNSLKNEPYDKPIWIRLNNLPMEYWTEESLEKIGKSLGTLIEIDADIATGDSYLYARVKL
ncbi:hypothetical protein SUGI_0294130 [Cryptomeria japonica]|nr:hypothetical protein SUGI_0294130 [Cryptomeria japonica]